WCQPLRLEMVGVDDYFVELGGDSLLAMRVIARVREVFDVELPLRALFEAATVSELSKRIEAARCGEPGQVVPGPVERPRPKQLPLSFAQERLWVLEQLGASGPA